MLVLSGTVTVALLLFFSLALLKVVNASAAYNLDGSRLAAAFVLKAGLPIYYPPEEGPVLVSSLNGPGQALAYLPATITPVPSLAISVGVLLSLIFYFGATFFLHWCCGRLIGAPSVFVVGAFGIFVFLSLSFQSPRASAFLIHADAPALGLTAMAFALMLFGLYSSKKNMFMVLSALCGVAAVYTKTPFLPVLLAVPFYVWLHEDFKTFAAYLGWYLGLFLCFGLITVQVIGWEVIKFNLWDYPGSFPWVSELGGVVAGSWNSTKLRVLGHTALELFQIYSVFVIGVFLFWFTSKEWRGSKAKGIRKLKWWTQDCPWSAALWASGWLLPVALIGRAKAKGDLNTFTPFVFFLFLAISLALMQWAHSQQREDSKEHLPRAPLVMAGILFFLILVHGTEFSRGTRTLASLEKDHHDKAVRFIHLNPGKAYFPEYQLEHFLGEGKLYHSGFVLDDRVGGDYQMSRQHFNAHIPPNFKYLVLSSHRGDKNRGHYLAAYTREVQPDGLEGWLVYARR